MYPTVSSMPSPAVVLCLYSGCFQREEYNLSHLPPTITSLDFCSPHLVFSPASTSQHFRPWNNLSFFSLNVAPYTGSIMQQAISSCRSSLRGLCLKSQTHTYVDLPRAVFDLSMLECLKIRGFLLNRDTCRQFALLHELRELMLDTVAFECRLAASNLGRSLAQTKLRAVDVEVANNPRRIALEENRMSVAQLMEILPRLHRLGVLRLMVSHTDDDIEPWVDAVSSIANSSSSSSFEFFVSQRSTSRCCLSGMWMERDLAWRAINQGSEGQLYDMEASVLGSRINVNVN